MNCGCQGKLRIDENDIFRAVAGVHRRCRGGYAAVAMIPGYGVVAFRDPYGIRPLVFGSRETDDGTEFMVASESVALDTLGFDAGARRGPRRGGVHRASTASSTPASVPSPPILSPCIFEFVYFARPDSIIDDIFVHKARLRMGKTAGQQDQARAGPITTSMW